MTGLVYRIGSASHEDLSIHLKACADYFNPPLDSRVNISDYALKISVRAVTFEAWSADVLAGLVAAYLDRENGKGFITSVSTVKEFTGRGIAKMLMQMCVDYSRKHGIRELSLEVSKESGKALRLYDGCGFNRELESEGMIRMKLDVPRADRGK